MDHQQTYCQVCERAPTGQLDFFCCACARATVWNTRIHHTQTLLDKERLSKDVSSLGRSDRGADGAAREDGDGGAARTTVLRRLEADKRQADELSQACAETCAEIKREIAALKASINQRRDEVAHRRAAATANKRAMAAQVPKTIPAQQEAVQKVEGDWAKLHSAICQDRVLLCREVAKIYGLEVKKRRRDSVGRDIFLLGGTPIVDLREMNNASPKLITVSTGRLAHVLHLASHYLGVQLPAQIDLPSPGNPFTLMHTPTTSYKDAALPTLRKAGPSAPGTPATKSRQRVLHLEKPLPALALEDPVSYSLFIDAVALLAWDLTWLAKTQGVDIGARHWDDVCAMGRTLWLLFGPQASAAAPLRSTPPPSQRRASASNPHHPAVSSPMARTPSGGAGRRQDEAVARGAHQGFYSHSSARAFVPAAPAAGGMADAMRGWQFASPIRLIERVKAILANDRAGTEWEMLDKDEWAGAEDEGAGGAQGEAEEQGMLRPTHWMRLRTKTGGLL